MTYWIIRNGNGLRAVPMMVCLLAVLLSTSCGASASQNVESASIEDFVGLDLHNTEAIVAQIDREQDELMAICMSERGFEWQPDPKIETVFPVPDDGLEYGTREWVEKYGFGISTNLYPQSQLPVDLVGFLGEPDIPEGKSPNQIYVESLAPDEREAYESALNGPSGCYNEALDEARENSGLVEFQETFGSQIVDLRERVASDQRILDYDDKVSRCTLENGVEFSSPSEFEEYVSARMEQVRNSGGDSNTEGGASSVPSDAPDINDVAEATYSPPPAVLEVLAELQAEEVSVALQFFDCGQNEDRQVLADKVWSEYESDFVSGNKDDLVAFKEKYRRN